MNRGVIAYVREGRRCAKNTFKTKMNYFKYYLMSLVTLFGYIFIFTIPLVVIANIRMARLAERDEDIQIFKSFEKADNSKTFWTVFGYFFMWFIFFLAGVILLAILAGGLFGIGVLIGGVSTAGYVVGGVLAAPMGIALVVFILLYPFMFAPAMYLYDCNTKLGLSGMFFNSIYAMRKTGKWSLFMMNVITVFRLLLWLGITAGLVFLLIANMDNQIYRILFSILLLVSLIIDFFRIPKIGLSYSVSKILLFNDICSSEKYVSLNPVTEENTPKNIYGVSKRTLRAASKEQLLMGLFSEGTKLTDPKGFEQSNFPNEVKDEVEPDEEVDDVKEMNDDPITEVYDSTQRESSRYFRPSYVTTEVEEGNPIEEEIVSESIVEDEVVEPVNVDLVEVVEEPVVDDNVEELPTVELDEVLEDEQVQIIDENIELSDETVIEPVIEEKPKRGRKKVVEEPAVEEKPKRSYNRKPKVEEPVDTTKSMEQDINVLLDEILNTEEVVEEASSEEVKPKRGRKPKTITEEKE